MVSPDFRDQRIGKARVINPGALCHPRDPRYPTVAVLDTEADALEYIPLPH
jgi:predicted phosphodiesterase